MVGMLLLEEGEVKVMLLGDKIVTEGHGGEGVAQNMFSTVTEYRKITKEMLQEQNVGLAFDGQYFNLHVPGKKDNLG